MQNGLKALNKLCLIVFLILIGGACSSQTESATKVNSLLRSTTENIKHRIKESRKQLDGHNKEQKHKIISEQTINQNHRFELSPCEYKYNGQSFKLDSHIEKLIELFGLCSRVKFDAYIWDSIGISAYVYRTTYETARLRFNLTQDKYRFPDDITPEKEFCGNILINGTLFGKDVCFETFKTKCELNIPGGYWEIWSHTKAYTYSCPNDYTEELGGYSENRALSFGITPEGNNRSFSITSKQAKHNHEIFIKNLFDSQLKGNTFSYKDDSIRVTFFKPDSVLLKIGEYENLTSWYENAGEFCFNGYKWNKKARIKVSSLNDSILIKNIELPSYPTALPNREIYLKRK